MKKFNPKDFQYICSQCAAENRATWPEGHQATHHWGKCDVCESYSGLCHVTDWEWPGKQPGLREL